MTKALMKSCVFVVCKTLLLSVNHKPFLSCKQNIKHKNAELSILAGEDMTPKNPLDICANIAVTKHVLLADEFVPYRPRLLAVSYTHLTLPTNREV